jgi:hypothetical protein
MLRKVSLVPRRPGRPPPESYLRRRVLKRRSSLCLRALPYFSVPVSEQQAERLTRRRRRRQARRLTWRRQALTFGC